MSKKKIAVLGATSHIAKGLIYNFNKKSEEYDLTLFARNIEKTKEFCNKEKINTLNIKEFSSFDDGIYDVIINCVGAGTPTKLKELGGEIFEITEKYDNMCIEYINKRVETLYINLSSGAVYGKEFDKAISNETKVEIDINNLTGSDFYSLAKINSEAKHRAMDKYNIVDLRVFAYFSRFIDLDGKYLMTEIVNSIKENKVFRTTAVDIVRDYVHPEDFFSLVEKCIEQKKINDVFDVYSLKPVTKFELLKGISESMSFNYEIDGELEFVNATGLKSTYYSENKKAEKIGYRPKYSSMESIKEEIKIILK